MRHLLACGPGRQAHDRAARGPPDRGRLRLGVSLPRPDRGRAHAHDRHHAVGRDGRHAGRAARGEEEGGPQHRHLQRGRQHGDARGRRHRLHARRARDRRRVDQGVHVAARRAVPAGALPRADARTAHARRGASAHRGAAAPAAPARRGAEGEPADRGGRRAVPHPHRLPVPRPRDQLPDRARGRAEAEGDLLHPRRGLSRRRDEARAHRAHRRADARRGDRAARRGVREDARQRAGGEGARRVGHRAHDTGRRQAAAAARPLAGRDRDAAARARAADADRGGRARCSCSRTTSPSAAAATSISRGTSRRASR